MFDDETRPMTDQILEEMVEQGYDEDAVETARVEMKEKCNLTYANNLAKILVTTKLGKMVLDRDEELQQKVDLACECDKSHTKNLSE